MGINGVEVAGRIRKVANRAKVDLDDVLPDQCRIAADGLLAAPVRGLDGCQEIVVKPAGYLCKKAARPAARFQQMLVRLQIKVIYDPIRVFVPL